MSEARIYASGGINWNWYLGGLFDDAEMTVELKFHERWHKGEEAEGWMNRRARWEASEYEVLEDKTRTVYGVRIGKREYLVMNPGYVFSYKDLEMLKEMA